MVKDRKAASTSKSNQFFALKVQKSAEHYTEAAMDEVELLDCISNERKAVEQAAMKGGKDDDGVGITDIVEYSKYVATLHDSFFHTGPNGKHMCMVFSMLGCNLLSVIKAYNYRGIPIPVVKNMIRGICKGLDFLHRKCHIIHTDLKPENVLLLFEEGEEDLKNSMAGLSIEDKKDNRNPMAQSILELEASLQNQNLSPEERKKLRRRLKKKRQKERKRTYGADDDGGSSDGSDEEDEDLDTVEEDGDDDKKESASFLSDWEMSKILSKAANMMSSPVSDSGILPVASTRVKRRLSHSAFVTSNFGHRQVSADSKLMDFLRDAVDVKCPTAEELEADFRVADQKGGIAEVAFVLRAFTPEEELADGLTAALGGIKWENSPTDRSIREW